MAEEIAAPARAERATAASAYDTATVLATTTGIPAEHLAEWGVETERRRRAAPDFITNMMTDFCLQLGDKPKSIKSSITRATKIYYTACAIFKDFQEDPEGLFIEMLYQAKRSASSAVNVRHRGGMNGGRWNRMPLFFHILEKMFEFTEDEAAYLRSDQPLLL